MHALRLTVVAASVLATSALAGGRCFELSTTPRFAGPSASLCVSDLDAQRATLLLREGAAIVGTFELELTSRVRCLDCNRDVFARPSAPFDALRVAFNGTAANGVESGVVTIAGTRFFYRGPGPSSGPPAPPPSPASPAPPGPPPPIANQGMAAERFDALLAALDAQQWSVSGIKGVVGSAAKTNFFTSEQVAVVLRKVPGQALKQAAATKLVPRIVDPENIHLVSSEIHDDAMQYRGNSAKGDRPH